MSNRFLTISVDDGHPTDFRTAEILNKHNLNATFYIPKNNPERTVLDEQSVKQLSSQFEIGAHTISHLPLHKMNNEQAYEEIYTSKVWLENLLSKKCISFCYPQGKFNRNTPSLVKNAGFIGARNCYFNRNEIIQNRFMVGVSTHAYSHSPLIQIRHALIEKNFLGTLNYIKDFQLERNWVNHFLKAARMVHKNGGIAHLFLHSWEIDSTEQWTQLDNLLKLIKEFELTSITNGEHFEMIYKNE